MSLKEQGKRLRTARKECAMTKEEVAEALDISPRTVDNHEQGRNAPGPALIRAYAALYKREPRWLTGATPEMHKLADAGEIYGRTRQMERDGSTFAVTEFSPSGEVPEDIAPARGLLAQLQDQLARILESPDPSLATALMANMAAFGSLAEKDQRIRELEEEIGRLKRDLGKILDVLARHAKTPESENRQVMKELSQVVDGNTLISRLKR